MKDHWILCLCLMVWSVMMASCQRSEQDQAPLLTDPKEVSSSGRHIEEPYLFSSPTGEVYLSWIEKTEGLSSLYYAKWDNEDWSKPTLVASGSDWFVNWADYPQMQFFSDGTMVAAFLRKNGEGTFAYDVMLTFSQDGKLWTEPKVLHDDGTQTEHGFVSMIPWEEDIFITWLDGRNTGSAGQGVHDHGHHGQMTLRAARLDSDGNKLAEWELDDRVCDCCQTSVTLGTKGPIVVFRDRSENEIRDIGSIHWTGYSWTSSMPVHADFWEIAACPVNGPRIDSRDTITAVVWYTAAQDKPRVQVAFLQNGGKQLGAPISVDLGKTIGRVDLALDIEARAWVTWMEAGEIYLRWISSDGRKGNPIRIAESSGKRSSGFPQLSATPAGVMVAWTDDSEEYRKIKTVELYF